MIYEEIDESGRKVYVRKRFSNRVLSLMYGVFAAGLIISLIMIILSSI